MSAVSSLQIGGNVYDIYSTSALTSKSALSAGSANTAANAAAAKHLNATGRYMLWESSSWSANSGRPYALLADKTINTNTNWGAGWLFKIESQNNYAIFKINMRGTKNACSISSIRVLESCGMASSTCEKAIYCTLSWVPSGTSTARIYTDWRHLGATCRVVRIRQLDNQNGDQQCYNDWDAWNLYNKANNNACTALVETPVGTHIPNVYNVGYFFGVANSALSASYAPVDTHTISSHSDSANFFSGNSARSACSARSAQSANSAASAYNGRWSKADDNTDLDRPLGMAFCDASASWNAGNEFYRNTVYDISATFNSKTNTLKVPILSATTVSANLSGSARSALSSQYAVSAGAAPVATHTISSHSDSANFFSGNSAKSACSATSAKNAGTAQSAGTAASVNASQWNADSARYILFGENKASTTVGYDSDLTYNPSSNKLLVKNISSTNITATTFSGNLSGSAASAINAGNSLKLSGTDGSAVIGSAQSGYKALTALSALSGIKTFNTINASSGTGTVTAITAGSSGASWNLKVAGVMSITADTATNTITLSSRDNNSTAYIPSGQKISGIDGTTTGQYFLSALKLNAGDNITFTSASTTQLTINATQPTVGNGTITINTGSTTSTGTFTTNQNTNTTITLGSMALTQTGTYFSGTSALSALTSKSAQTAAKGTWVRKSDNNNYPICFSLNSEWNYASAADYQWFSFNPASAQMTVASAVKIGGCQLKWNASTSALDFNF